MDKNFPLHLWDRLLEQAAITLNMLRASHLNPKLSAYTTLEGTFDFNSTHMVPPGTRCLIHEPPNQSLTWVPHATDVWYMGPAMHHCRCYRAYVPSTRSDRIVEKITFIPDAMEAPYLTAHDEIIRAAAEFTVAINKPTRHSPYLYKGDTLKAIKQLEDLFRHSLPSPNRKDNENRTCIPKQEGPIK